LRQHHVSKFPVIRYVFKTELTITAQIDCKFNQFFD